MNTTQLKTLLRSVEDTSLSIGAFIKAERQKNLEISEKSFNNLVTHVDKASEEKFVAALALLLPEAGFIAEEGTSSKESDEYNWIIDPIDGTTNFIHNIPAYCTSIGLAYKGVVILGVIYDPSHDELFSAAKGCGAFLNRKPLTVSKTTELERCLLATGFPYDDFERETGYFAVLKAFTHKTRGLRRLGSAALDLAYVAAGRFDAFYEYGLNPWDVAAGIIIVQEANGSCSDFKGGSNMLFGEEIIATNKLIHQDVLDVVQNGL